jgi:hypothetical protein
MLGNVHTDEIEREKQRLRNDFERESLNIRQQYEAERLTKDDLQKKYDDLKSQYDEQVNLLAGRKPNEIQAKQ